VSAKRGRARGSIDGHRRLVLVRGGLDAPRARPDADWESFCGRIGWQQGPGLADNDEQHLIDRMLRSTEIATDAHTDGTDRPVARTAEARAALPRRRSARDPFLASTAMAAAAALFLFLAAAFSWAQQRSARATPVPAHDRAQPVDDRAAPLRTEPALPEERAPEAPAPTETATPIESREPGSLVADARANRKQGPRNRASRARKPIAAHAAAATDADLVTRGEPAPEPLDGLARAGAADFTPALFERVALSSIAMPPSPAAWTEPGPTAAAVEPRRASRAEPATWAVSSTSDRWYGVTLPPSGDAERFPANVGVLAQVDLGKALRL
jgi:hypothetical protein